MSPVQKKKARESASARKRASVSAPPSRYGRPGSSRGIREYGPLLKRKAKWNLRLYIASQTPATMDAIANLQQICEEHLRGEYRIEVIDLLQRPQLAAGDQIIAVPTLVRKLPTPVKRIIGYLSNTCPIRSGY